MSYTPAIDVSQWQGDIDFNAISEPIVIIKMSGGDNGLYFDSKANQNYNRAINAGKTVGMYHFAGGTDPFHEADYFIKAVSPLAVGDVLILDWEVSHPNPVDWCSQFINHVHEVTGVWPILYINTSTCQAHNWSSILANCGLWLADYRYSPEQDIPGVPPYIIHQYTSTPLDKDAVFLSVDLFKAYGYLPSTPQVSTPVIEPVSPTNPPEVTPIPDGAVITVTPTPVPAPVVEPKSPPTPTTQPTLPNSQSSPSLPGGWFHAMINFLIGLFNFKKGR